DRLSANAHLRHHRRLPAALGRSLGTIAAARGLDGGGPGPAARLLGAALLHHRGWPRRAHQHGRTRRLALAVARLLSTAGVLQRRRPVGRFGADRRLPQLDRTAVARKPHAATLL